MNPLARTVEALLFLSSEPVTAAELRDAAGCDDFELEEALEELRAAYAPGERGIELRDRLLRAGDARAGNHPAPPAEPQ